MVGPAGNARFSHNVILYKRILVSTIWFQNDHFWGGTADMNKWRHDLGHLWSAHLVFFVKNLSFWIRSEESASLRVVEEERWSSKVWRIIHHWRSNNTWFISKKNGKKVPVDLISLSSAALLFGTSDFLKIKSNYWSACPHNIKQHLKRMFTWPSVFLIKDGLKPT